MGEKRSKAWYEFEHQKTGIDIFNKGIHVTRAIALAKLIAADNSKRICEVAAGGSILAREVLKLLPNAFYCWSDFSEPAITDARKKLVGRKIIFSTFDIDQDYKYFDYRSYDAFICVSMEHLENDKEILQQIPPGGKVYLSIPNIDAPDHIRVLSTDEQIKERYGDILDIKLIEDCGETFKLVVGVRSE